MLQQNPQDPIHDLDGLLERKRGLEARVSAAPEFVRRLRELRTWQAARLARTYDDLRRDPAHSRAVEFFLTDLCGGNDSARRDRDLARASGALTRTLPHAALAVLERSVELEVLNAELDQAMIAQLGPGPLTAATYAAAYRAVGKPDMRKHQIDLTISVGEDLNHIVQHTWIGLALRAAHAPAHAAGFGAFQDYLERGFAAFRQMNGSLRLLQAIRERETRLMEALLRGRPELLDVDS